MAATWPLAPAAARADLADLTLANARQVPWLSSNDYEVTELLLSLNDGRLEELQHDQNLSQGTNLTCTQVGPHRDIEVKLADGDESGGGTGHHNIKAVASFIGARPLLGGATGANILRHDESKAVTKAGVKNKKSVYPGRRSVPSASPVRGNSTIDPAAASRSSSNGSRARRGREPIREGPDATGRLVLPLQLKRAASPDSVCAVREVLQEAVLTARPETSTDSSATPTPFSVSPNMSASPISSAPSLARDSSPPGARERGGSTKARARPPALPASQSRNDEIRYTQVKAKVQSHRQKKEKVQPSNSERVDGTPVHSNEIQHEARNSAAPEVIVGGAPIATSHILPQDGDRMARQHDNSVLRCHVLFSSPLCVERPVVVRLPCGTLAFAALEDQVESWSVEFEPSQPSIVRRVLPGGLLSQWNAEQKHLESLVRPGDELLFLSAAGLREGLRGRSLLMCLAELAKRVNSARETGSIADTCTPNCVELVFRAVRALSPLQVGHEIELLRQSGCQVTSSAATAHNVRALIASADCPILHMALHCAVAQEQLLFLEDGQGKAHVIQAEQLRKMLTCGQHEQSIRLVFVNSCHSMALGLHFVHAGVRHVVCVKNEQEVRDASCRLFARDFFAALRAGRNVQDAFNCGKAVLACSQEQHFKKDAESFVLLPEDGDHQVTLTSEGGAQLAPHIPAQEGGAWGNMPSTVEDFLGREADVHRLLCQIHHRRFVEVRGERGVGKSSVLSEAGRFLSLRLDAFKEVRWVGPHTIDAAPDCSVGLQNLRQRLAATASRHLVLLLVDDPPMEVWADLQPLLRFQNVHIAMAIPHNKALQMAESDACAGLEDAISPATKAAVAAGLKPTSFTLGPLEPLMQVQLFLRRAPRPLRKPELFCKAAGPHDAIVDVPQRPLDYVQLAETPLFQSLGGNPAHLVNAALRFGMIDPTSEADRGIEDHEFSADASAGPSRSLLGEGQSFLSGGEPVANRRKVRLLRPDGHSRDVWLPRSSTIADVIKGYCPKSLPEGAVIFIGDCHAPGDALLGHFPDDEDTGLLALEFRDGTLQDDW